MNTKFYNKHYINDLICDLHESLNIHIDMIFSSKIWENAVYFSKISKDFEFSFFTICCKDGNLEITNLSGFNKKQIFLLNVIKEKMFYRLLDKNTILEFINKFGKNNK